MGVELQHGNKEATLQEDELQDGQTDHELPTDTTVVEQRTVLEIEHRLGHQVLRLQHMVCRMVSQLVPRPLDMAEEIHGAPKPRLINHSKTNLITAGKI